MGKVNKQRSLSHSNHHDNPNRSKKNVVRRQHSQNALKKPTLKGPAKNVPGKPKPNSPSQTQQPKPKVPFSRWDQVLLIGEGDFSFGLSLAKHLEVGCIVATCYDSKDALEQKYPGVSKTIGKLSPNNKGPVVDGASKDYNTGNVNNTDDEWNGFSSTQTSEDDEDSVSNTANHSTKTSVLYGIDATKLSSVHKKTLRPHSPFTKIVFNFPHVGGLSTDVNRQVRSNQQLLVDFFNAAKPLLATKSNPAKRPILDEQDDDMEYGSDAENDANRLMQQQDAFLMHGQILVTIFEGEPYTLWNIRDLARHSGLKVLESFKFPWAAYPGYKHARTIGDITSGKDRSDEGKRKGAWRGEERDARCYILALKDDDGGRPAPGSQKRKRTANDDDN